ncbi:alkaline phosphatase family protein [Photobacterium sagamiensis]|uniref:alkaline phosphatase family protein n=1 Tax=Photobacterium sagamiensis TaxID=2910241 RepID=UPI003D13E909
MNSQFTKNFTSTLFSLAFVSSSALADIGSAPVIGALYNSTQVIKEHIVAGIDRTATTTRDAALFTIGGLTLDAYILTLPVEAKVKARVISQLSNPRYAIQLGHFLYLFYDRYTGLENTDIFKRELKSVYSKQELVQYQHSLFTYDDGDDSPHTISEASEKNDSIAINSQLIASMVTIYDTLFNNDKWLFGDELPEQYQYLIKNPDDIAIINKIQPLIIELLTQYSQTIANGEIKSAIVAIIDDAKPENADKINNKAEAITVTLIDFVRLNALKGYRQFALEQLRIDAFDAWMKNAFNHRPDELIQFLTSQNNKRYGVQITVDGLQQGLLKALTREQQTPFIQHVYLNHKNHTQYKPETTPTVSPAHQQQLSFLTVLATSPESDAQYLPFFKGLYSNYSRSIAENGISSTPTISVRNLPIIMTGANVAGKGGTGIPNFHFVDRTLDRAYYFFGNDALQLDRLMEDNQVQTMFDRLSYLKTLNCNAQYDWNAQVSYDGLVNLAVGEALRDFGEQRCLREISLRAKVEKKVIKERAELIEEITQYQTISLWTPITKFTKKQFIKEKIRDLAESAEGGMPDYVLIYNPWPDHFAHFKGPFSDEIISPTGELNRLDYWLTQYSHAYKDAGIYHNTLWGMAGDHGLTPVYYALNPEKQVLAELQKERDLSFNIKKISSDEGEGPKITNALNYPSNKKVDVVVASTAGGNFMMDFFNSAQGWQYQPRYSELVKWLPLEAARDFTPIDMISEIANRLEETLDYLVVRETNCSVNACDVRLVAHRDGKRLDEIIKRSGDRLYYGSAKEAEGSPNASQTDLPRLLDIQAVNPYTGSLSAQEQNEKQQLVKKCLSEPQRKNNQTWCNEAEWRQLTRLTPRPDSVNQLAHLYDEDRAGTVNLFPKEGIGYNTIVPGRHAGEHYLEKDAFIGFWGEPVGQGEQLKSVANGSLAPTIYEYLSGDNVVVGENGWGFPSLLSELAIQNR